MVKRLTLAILVLAAIPAAAADKWTSLKSKNFLLAGNASQSALRDVAESLELFRWGFLQFFRMPQTASSVGTTVVVFQNDDAFRPFKPVYNGKAANVAGYFQGGRDMNFIALSADKETPRVIYHELVHRLMSDNFSSLPPWFQEGFAECFGSLEVEGRAKKLRIGRAIGEHVELLNQQRFMPLEQLFAVTHDSREYNESEKQGLFYAQSWALVHYLMLGEGSKYRPQFFEFLEGLRTNKAPAPQLFQQVFQTDLSSFQKKVEAYVRQRVTWPALEIPSPAAQDRDKEMQAQSLSEGQWEFYLGDLLLHANRLAEADLHLQRSVQKDPELASTQAALGRLRMRQNNEEDALAYLRRATELDSTNYLTHYYYASVIRSRKTPPSDSEWETMRSSLTKAVQLAPQFIEATEMLAGVNLARNIDIPKTVELLVKAMQVSRGSENLVVMLAFALSRTAEREMARPYAGNILASPTATATMKQNARNVLEFLDQSRAMEMSK